MKNLKIYLILYITVYIPIYGQQQPMFTQYMFNGLVINPAYAGSHESLSMTSLARYQWVGLEGSPKTLTFSAHTPLQNEHIGLGATIVADRIGITDQQTVSLNYAYRVRLNSSYMLSLGLSGSLQHTTLDYTKLDQSDPAFSVPERNFKPNLGLGIYTYSRRMYAGISAPYVISHASVIENEARSLVDQVRHYYLTAGALFDLGSKLGLRPSVLVKAVRDVPIEVDLNANLIISDLLLVGISYRSFDAANLILGINISERLQVSYAYDITISKLREVSGGSHELALNYRIPINTPIIYTPRYF